MIRRFLPLAAAAAALPAACVSQGDSPSLAPRPAEREFSNAPPPTGPCAADTDGCYQPEPARPAPPADDAALQARVATLRADAARGQQDFSALLATASSRAAAAGEAGSEGWIAAQQELSRLEAARTATRDALASIEALALERARVPTSEVDLAAIAAAADEARALAEEQDRQVQALRDRLSRPSALRGAPSPAPHSGARPIAGRRLHRR